MSDTFTTDVYPVVVKYAALRFGRDDELRAMALVLAWWAWRLHREQDTGEELPPTVWAQAGVRWAAAGRELPGVRVGKFRDVWDYLTRWQGAGMQNVIDRRAFPPDRIAAGREELEAVLAGGGDATDRELIRLILEESLGTNEIARRLGVTPAAISQRRRKWMERLTQE
jgi:DNA-binding CsgD family transcriptional regulator